MLNSAVCNIEHTCMYPLRVLVKVDSKRPYVKWQKGQQLLRDDYKIQILRQVKSIPHLKVFFTLQWKFNGGDLKEEEKEMAILTKTECKEEKHQYLIKRLYVLGNVSFDKPSKLSGELCSLHILRGARQGGKLNRWVFACLLVRQKFLSN